MDNGESRARAAFVGVAVALGVLAVVGTMGTDSGGLTEAELQFPDELVDRESYDTSDYANCASMIGCLDWNERDRKRWVEERLAAGEDPLAPHEPASNCVGFCFNAIVESVDEKNWRLARVVMIGKKGKRTPALVERSSILSSSRIPAADGKPVRFACFDRFRGEEGLRFESCSQMATTE